MKLHTVFITYNRLELTKETILSYRETVHCPYTFCVVDNASSDDTRRWLLNTGFDVHLLSENRYPGYASNFGWSHAPDDATHLHRSDNDFRFLLGWSEQVEYAFQSEKVGKVGLRTDAEDEFAHNTGGNCVIRRDLFDKGLRYDERPWPQIRAEVGDGYSEDSFFSAQVRQMGYTWTRVKQPAIQNLASGDWGDPYYVESYGVRGIRPRAGDPTVPEGFVPYDS